MRFLKEELMDGNPNPGSAEAIEAGCKCPVIDNHHGNGFPALDRDGGRRTAFWISAECPIHGIKTPED